MIDSVIEVLRAMEAQREVLQDIRSLLGIIAGGLLVWFCWWVYRGRQGDM